jgi:N-methylhydantoinase A
MKQWPGIDPAEFSVIAFGGAGPAHVVEVVEEFDVRSIIIPTTPGLASAAGLLVTDMAADHVRTRVTEPDALDAGAINALFGEMEDEGLAGMRAEGIADAAISIERTIDARFRGQGHELPVPVPQRQLTEADLVEAQQNFRAKYREFYGVDQPGPVQLVNFRVRVVGQVPKLALGRAAAAQGPAEGAIKNWRPVHFRAAGGFVDTPVYDRGALAPGHAFAGPAVVEEADSTTIVPPGYRVTVGAYLQLEITRG